NRSPYAAPQGLYACQGEEQWLALSVESDAQWQALVKVLGNPAWAKDAVLATHAGRYAARAMLDAHLADWATSRDLGETVAVLQQAGVPASTVTDCRVAFKHPQFRA